MKSARHFDREHAYNTNSRDARLKATPKIRTVTHAALLQPLETHPGRKNDLGSGDLVLRELSFHEDDGTPPLVCTRAPPLPLLVLREDDEG